MSKANKVWSTEMTETVVNAYVAAEYNNESLAAIAKENGKTVQAVRSKLVSERVYVASAKRAVGGASAVRKIALVREISELLEVEELTSFEKGSKADLQALLDALKA